MRAFVNSKRDKFDLLAGQALCNPVTRESACLWFDKMAARSGAVHRANDTAAADSIFDALQNLYPKIGR